MSMNAVQRGNARLQAGMLVPGPFYRRQGIDSFAFRLSLLFRVEASFSVQPGFSGSRSGKITGENGRIPFLRRAGCSPHLSFSWHGSFSRI
ncbi:hypothetical protein CXU13_09510 [Akkermansia muciniphila]|nr:hypothetical protein CXU16_11555 [Akkermansia muciniphila]PNC37850.1 hypothetical protein CXU10_05915 [Akkermansia muciniphila]PNC45702.1 hypothetical protein CXU14_04905 [Akkermansia muciniphila]PNC58754.1 hypothetical protein CXU13_09510 [Akkermansia muciniphila]